MLAEVGRTRFVYLVDEQGRLTGWLDRAQLKGGCTVEDALSDADPAQVAVRPDASLKEALSRMLGLGFRSIAVVESDGRLVGQVTLGSVEGAMTESDEHQGARPAEHMAEYSAEDTSDDSVLESIASDDQGDCT
jgi:CBS domain-containing protein